MTEQFCAVDRDRAVDAVIAGHCDRRFADLAAALADEITTGGELGAAIAIDIDGELVVDMWGGYVDKAMSRPPRIRDWIFSSVVSALVPAKGADSVSVIAATARSISTVS